MMPAMSVSENSTRRVMRNSKAISYRATLGFDARHTVPVRTSAPLARPSHPPAGPRGGGDCHGTGKGVPRNDEKLVWYFPNPLERRARRIEGSKLPPESPSLRGTLFPVPWQSPPVRGTAAAAAFPILRLSESGSSSPYG